MFFERKGESIHPCISSEVFTTQVREKESGCFSDELVGNADIPEPRLFKLDYLLSNNVPLKQVNTKILGGSFEDLGENDNGVTTDDGSKSTSSESGTEE